MWVCTQIILYVCLHYRCTMSFSPSLHRRVHIPWIKREKKEYYLFKRIQARAEKTGYIEHFLFQPSIEKRPEIFARNAIFPDLLPCSFDSVAIEDSGATKRPISQSFISLIFIFFSIQYFASLTDRDQSLNGIFLKPEIKQNRERERHDSF